MAPVLLLYATICIIVFLVLFTEGFHPPPDSTIIVGINDGLDLHSGAVVKCIGCSVALERRHVHRRHRNATEPPQTQTGLYS